MTHTTGPWITRGCELVGESTILATLHWHSGRASQNEADAHLIAAAPELLEALILVAQRCGPMSSDGAIARAAIAKARGETTDAE